MMKDEYEHLKAIFPFPHFFNNKYFSTHGRKITFIIHCSLFISEATSLFIKKPLEGNE